LTAPTIEARLRGQKPGPSKPLAKSVNDAGSSTDGGRYWRRDQLTSLMKSKWSGTGLAALRGRLSN